MFPYQPQQSGYNKRLKAALPLVKKVIQMFAVYGFLVRYLLDRGLHAGAVRDVAADGEAVRAGRLGRIRVLRLAFPVLLGHCACTRSAPRPVCRSCGRWPAPRWTSARFCTDKGFSSKEFESDLAMRGISLLRPSFTREKKRPGESLLKWVRQLIESVNDTLKGQSHLEQHGGRTSFV